MAIRDAIFNWGLPTITNSTATTVSANVTDIGTTAKIVFGYMARQMYLKYDLTITADASPTFRIDVVASDESDLDPDNSEASNDILGSTGVINMKQDGSAALASGDTWRHYFPFGGQTKARRYYGLLVTLGGTNPDLAAGQPAYATLDPQTHLQGAQEAVPAT